jgi:hypothetical protein
MPPSCWEWLHEDVLAHVLLPMTLGPATTWAGLLRLDKQTARLCDALRCSWRSAFEGLAAPDGYGEILQGLFDRALLECVQPYELMRALRTCAEADLAGRLRTLMLFTTSRAYLSCVRLDQIGCFCGDPLELKLKPGVNVIEGNHGVGKSMIALAISAALCCDHARRGRRPRLLAAGSASAGSIELRIAGGAASPAVIRMEVHPTYSGLGPHVFLNGRRVTPSKIRLFAQACRLALGGSLPHEPGSWQMLHDVPVSRPQVLAPVEEMIQNPTACRLRAMTRALEWSPHEPPPNSLVDFPRAHAEGAWHDQPLAWAVIDEPLHWMPDESTAEALQLVLDWASTKRQALVLTTGHCGCLDGQPWHEYCQVEVFRLRSRWTRVPSGVVSVSCEY